MNLCDAQQAAYWVLSKIDHLCATFMIVGSIRRERPAVNDIDIVVIPRVPTAENWDQIARKLTHAHNMAQIKKGPQLMSFQHYDRDHGTPDFFNPSSADYSVDIYHATPETWGILVLVRTGSKEHNVKLCNLALSKGMKLSAAEGLLKPVASSSLCGVVASKTEEGIFAALGMSYVEPKDREV
jgi:DNA polymerase/3'-5' exonuclease PolX